MYQVSARALKPGMSPSTDPCTHWASLPDDDLTVDLVQRCLKSINNDLWVTAACVDRLVNDAAVQRVLLELGIERTQNAVECAREAFVPSSSKGGDDDKFWSNSSQGTDVPHDSLVAHFRQVPAHAQLCCMRAVLLERLDRLNTYVEICRTAPEKEEEDGIEVWSDDPWGDGTAESSTIPGTTPLLDPPVTLTVFMMDHLLRTSCLLASHQWFAALRVLSNCHASFLWPYRFTVLDKIPEHVHPLQFRDILPAFNNLTDTEHDVSSSPWRPDLDWSERSEVKAAVKESGISLPVERVLDSFECEAKSELLSAVDLSKWYESRIDHIISSTGMVDIALATLQHGASQGVPYLDELGEELSLLSRLIYDSPQREEGDDDEDWTLAQWNAMDPISVVRAYLTHSTPDTLPSDMNRLVMPYLFVLEARAERAGAPDPELPTRLLYDYILTTTLEMAAAIFEASKPTLLAGERLRVMRNDEDIARLALACLYGSDSLHEWSTMSRIFECLPAWDVAGGEDGNEDPADTTIISLGAFVTPSTTRPRCTASDLLVFFNPLPLTSLSRALDILDVHLECGEILARWNVPAPLRWFLQSNADVTEQRAWANRMARRAGGSEDKLEAQSDWAWLLDDMLRLCGSGESGLKGAFGLLDRKEVIHIFFSGLLSTGKFDIARGLLHASKNKLSLDSKSVEDICLSCSREFYDNASSGNYKFGDMKLAYQCLDLPPSSNRLLKEKEFIEATSRLSSFNVMSQLGIPISPIEVRLTKDRLSLVSRVLSSNADAYKHTEVILDLVRKLGFRDDVVAEVKAFAMLVETALQAEDFTRAYETSKRMVDTVVKLRSSAPLGVKDPEVQEASEVCWVACFQLGRQSEFNEIDKKLHLVGRALELCPQDKLHDVLTAWRRLEKQDIESRQARLLHHRSGTNAFAAPQSQRSALAKTLAARLQEFHMPSPPLLSTPDAAALASRTFKSVAANFPFSVSDRGRSVGSQDDDKSSKRSADVSTQATRVLSKGIGWLIGDDDS